MPTNDGLFGALIPHGWLPGETLFSLSSRHHWLSNQLRHRRTCQQLFGHPTQGCAHDFPSRIAHFVLQTEGQLGDAASIIRTRTLLAFYLPFASPSVAAAAVGAMEGPSIGPLKFNLGLLTSRFRAHHPLKACLECMAEDAALWATPYWHLEHQLPGVWTCSRHGSWLATSDLKATGVERFFWLLPSARHMQTTQREKPVQPAVQALASASTELIAVQSGRHFALDVVRTVYREALRDHGLAMGPCGQRLKLREIGADYAEFVRPLRVIGALAALPGTDEAAAAEVGRMVYADRSGTHPLRHLSMISWLFPNFGAFSTRYGEVLSRTLKLADPDVPPNAAVLDSRSKERQTLLALLSEGLTVSAASRRLGIDPSTAMAWAALAGIATPKRPSILKGDVRSAMVAALRRGASKADVAEIGGVSVVSVTRLLRTEVGLRDSWRESQFQKAQNNARKRWLRILAGNPWSGLKAARMLEPAAYAWLYRNDRDWLDDQAMRIERLRSLGGLRVDWDRRDREMADDVERIGAEIAEISPGGPVKLWQLYQRLPELKAKLAKMDRLPLTQAAIRRVLGSKATRGALLRQR